LPEKGSSEDKWDKWSIDYYCPIPNEYESPDLLFMERLEPLKVLERFQRKRSCR
jgi:hypothetical protein